MNFATHLEALVATDPDRPLLLRCDEQGHALETLTRQATWDRIQAAAAHLHHQGMGHSERIALETGSTIDTLIVSWAAWLCGMVTVPLDTKRDTQELRAYKLELTKPSAVLKTMPPLASASFSDWAPDSTQDALILFTSGTTAHPKGARLTLQNLLVNAESIADWLAITPDDRFLVLLPLHHINSTTFCLSALLAGASIAIPPQYSNEKFWKQAAHSGATLTSIVPTILFDQLNRKQEYVQVRDVLKLSRIQIGSAPVSASSALDFVKQYNIPLLQGYGQTETALRVTGVPPNLPTKHYHELLGANSIGTPLSWAEVEIMGEGGQMLGSGEEGELVVRGPAVMRGYLGGLSADKANEEAFRDEWFLTGDIGHWEEIGGRRFFYLTGRKKELIIKGGVNISPIAVENALQQVSADIAQAYVFPVTDERYGEEVGAAIVWKSDIVPDAAMRKLKWLLTIGDPRLSAYETPRYLATVAENELPMTSTGKVQRVLLKQYSQEKLEPTVQLFATTAHRFGIVRPHDTHAAASRALYNHCWQPLTLSQKEYDTFLATHHTLAAIDPSGTISGQIAFTYANGVFTCVSLCSATFKPKSVPEVSHQPTPDEVRAYLLAGHDPVMNFHRTLGAKLEEVIVNGRPADRSSLGYTMLLTYPTLAAAPIDESDRISHQLLHAVRMLAADLGREVFALSRPGGLAAYCATHHAV